MPVQPYCSSTILLKTCTSAQIELCVILAEIDKLLYFACEEFIIWRLKLSSPTVLDFAAQLGGLAWQLSSTISRITDASVHERPNL